MFQTGVMGTIALLLAVTIPLGVLTFHWFRDAALERQVAQALEVEVSAMGNVDWDGEWVRRHAWQAE